MSPAESPSNPPEPNPSSVAPRDDSQEWIYRGIAALTALALLWLGYRNQNNVAALLLIGPAIIGAGLTALRLPAVSEAIHSIEQWLRSGAAKASTRTGKLARFFQRPLFGSCLAVWRWTEPIRDIHLRAGVRLSALILICGIAAALLITAVYIIVAVVVLIAVIVIIGWFLSLSDRSQSSGRTIQVTRHAADWLGRSKDEHFDSSGRKVGESRPDTDLFGRPKTIHTDAAGNKTGESRPDTDWLGNPKTVHTDAAGDKTGESRSDQDWLGRPMTVHTDRDGNVVAESHVETDWLGEEKIVREDKRS